MKLTKHFASSRFQETSFYVAAWFFVFTVPIALVYMTTANAREHFTWNSVFVMWVGLLPFLLAFIVHDLLITPVLLKLKKGLLYLACSLALVALFMVATTSSTWRDFRQHQLMGTRVVLFKPPPPHPEPHPARTEEWFPDRFEVINPHALVNCVVLLMMLGVNIGVKMFFKVQRDERTMREVERQSLEKELEYLKYQINPHFFMNTLANIDALVEIDPKKARTSILDLSRMMRYALSEGAKTLVPLCHDIDFMRHYLSLMRLRYVKGVNVSVDFPKNDNGVSIPPLLFVTFIENAFKHGISYRDASFVDIQLTVDDNNVRFHCVNSRHADDKHGTGIGLENVRRRLNLIYGTRYKLHIEQPEGKYELSLIIPKDYDKVPCNG